MPVEIKELHIKAVVGGNTTAPGGAMLKPEEIARLKKEISKEVMDKITRLLQRKNER